MQAIAFLNLKGGVGKTSSVHHLSGAFAARGKRVLVVDNDPQSSLTKGFWGPDTTESLNPATTIHAVYDGNPLPGQVIFPTGFKGISVLPGCYAVSSINNGTASGGNWRKALTFVTTFSTPRT